MVLKCAQHGEEESDSRPIFLCHHCGKPVCEDHGTILLDDDDFAPSDEPLPIAAMHCPECVRYHSWRDGGRTGAGAPAPS